MLGNNFHVQNFRFGSFVLIHRDESLVPLGSANSPRAGRIARFSRDTTLDFGEEIAEKGFEGGDRQSNQRGPDFSGLDSQEGVIVPGFIGLPLTPDDEIDSGAGDADNTGKREQLALVTWGRKHWLSLTEHQVTEAMRVGSSLRWYLGAN
jgi:hypothetical protein